MDVYSICEELLKRLVPMGGHAGVFDDKAIFLEWNHMKGLVYLHPDGQISLKVSTPWEDADEETTEKVEEVPDRVARLFEGFWERRGIRFKKQPRASLEERPSLL